MTVTEITKIGKNAVNEELIFVLFGQTATKELEDISIIQKKMTDDAIQLQKGSKLFFGEQEYSVVGVGSNANLQLNELLHATVFFQEEAGDIPNAVYVSPAKLPKVEEGMKITFSVEVE